MNIALSNSLLDVLLKLPRRDRDWNAIITEAECKEQAESAKKERRHRNTSPSRELAGYTGAYEHPAYGMVRITLENGALVWHWNRFTAPLAHYHYDTFTLPIAIMGEPHVVFTLDERGTVKRMKVLGNMNVEFTRSR
jgi:hypothetical protein